MDQKVPAQVKTVPDLKDVGKQPEIRSGDSSHEAARLPGT